VHGNYRGYMKILMILGTGAILTFPTIDPAFEEGIQNSYELLRNTHTNYHKLSWIL